MTSVNQDFNMYAGDSKDIVVTIVDEENNPLDLTEASIKWVMKNKNTSVIKDSTNGASVDGSTLHIKLEPEDTINLSGVFAQQGRIVDALGNVSTVFVGKITILKSLV